MRNSNSWKPTKYVHKRGRLVGSRDTRELAIASRLSADLVAEHYDRLLRRHVRGRLLDLGCGKAPLFLVYREYVDEVICTDWSNTLHKSFYLDLVCDISKRLPFVDTRFDTIILSSVLEHVPDPALLWNEMARILTPGGKIILNSPFFYWIHEAPHDYYRYTEFALRRFVSTSGLELIVLETTGGALEILVDIFSKCVARVPGVGQLIAVFSQWMAGMFRRTQWGRRLSTKTSPILPLSYVLVAMKPINPAVSVN